MPGRLRWTLWPEDRLGDSLSVWPWIEKLIFQLKANASPLSNGKHATTTRRRLSRTCVVLARVTPKVWVPMSEMKARSFVVLSNHSASRAYRGGTIPWAPNHYGGANSLRGRRNLPTMSEVLSPISAFTSERLQVRTWGAKLPCYLWGAEVW